MAENNRTESQELYFIKLTVDLAFKYIFGEDKNIELLKSLLTDITKLPIERLEGLGLKGEELHRDSMTDHKTIVDVRAVLANATQIAIEMQVRNHKDMDKRSLYAWAKMYAGQLHKSERYKDLAKCICINIVAFDFTKEIDGHSMYVVKNAKTNTTFMEDFEMHFVELPKRAKVENERLQRWMALFSSKSWEEMEKNAKGDDVMERVYAQAREIALNETKRIEVENRERWLIDQNSLQSDAFEEGKLEGKLETAINMYEMGLSMEQMMKATGLSVIEIEAEIEKYNNE